MSSPRLAFIAYAVLHVLDAPAPAIVIWDEGIQTDFSNIQASPTYLLLGNGKNTIIGSVQTGADVNDWFTVTVPVGFQLDSLVNSAYDSVDDQGHIGFQISSVFVGAFNIDPSVYAGYSHFGHHAQNGSNPVFNSVDMDLFPIMQVQAAGSQGFSVPLGAGDYAFIIQQTGEMTSYQFDFNVTPVPEPGTILLTGIGCMTLVHKLRKARGTRS
jgi:hypothetical protein